MASSESAVIKTSPDNDPNHRVGKVDFLFAKPLKPDFGRCAGHARSLLLFLLTMK